MLTLDKIKLTVPNKMFTKASIKFIRIGQDKILTISKEKAKVINQKLIEWDYPIVFPAMINKQIKFQIFDKHQYGYNPEQFNNILHGTISNIIQAKENTWQVFSSTNQKVGFLSAKITRSLTKSKRISQRSLSSQYQQDTKNIQITQYQEIQKTEIQKTYIRSSQLNNSQIQQSQVLKGQTNKIQPKGQIQTRDIHLEVNSKDLYFSSIVVNLPEVKSKKVYIVITIGTNKIKTAPLKSRAGQLVFIEGYQFKYNPTIKEAVFQIFIVDEGDDSSSLFANGFLNLAEEKINRKVVLRKTDAQAAEIAGQALIQMNSGRKGTLANPIAKDALTKSMITHSINRAQQNSPLNTNSPQLADFFKSLNLRGSPSKGFMNHQYQSRPKRVSVMQRNSNILFPKQQRFKDYSQKKSQVCSYLGQRGLTFMTSREKHHYRGASIGYGNKVDFTSLVGRSVPGVGNYKLPSIWDRY